MSYILFLLTFFLCSLQAQNQYGYLCYSTTNIGDDIQALAAKRFLPDNALAFDRDCLDRYKPRSGVNVLMNGWFMEDKICWLSEDFGQDTSWPPQDWMNALLISVHFTTDFLNRAFSEESIRYLKSRAPIGARDHFTLEQLQKHGITSYFSGCLTLTLENPYTTRNDNIYVVDLDDEVVKYIKSKTTSPVYRVTHSFFIKGLPTEQRLKYADRLLDKYRKAKCVITARLHAALPCLAFNTPVLLVADGAEHPRFGGLTCLTRRCSREQLLQDSYDFDFNNPTENANDYLPIRENLIQTIENWKALNN